MTETKQALDAVLALPEKWRGEADPQAERLLHPDACEALNDAADDLASLLPALTAQVEQLQAALGEAERDAGRYRALRKEHVDSYIAVGKLESLDEQIDSAIDAMAAGEDAK